jgi:DNA-binding CsgD family transcriptional regulator
VEVRHRVAARALENDYVVTGRSSHRVQPKRVGVHVDRTKALVAARESVAPIVTRHALMVRWQPVTRVLAHAFPLPSDEYGHGPRFGRFSDSTRQNREQLVLGVPLKSERFWRFHRATASLGASLGSWGPTSMTTRVRVLRADAAAPYRSTLSDREGWVEPATLALTAADSLSSEVASLDAAGMILWANAAWVLAAQEIGGLLMGCAVGVNFLATVRTNGTTTAEPIAVGVAGVLAGERRSFDFEHEVSGTAGARRWRLQARPLHGSSRGAVLLRSEIPAPVRSAGAEPPSDDLRRRIAGLTPRERDVLRLMVRGFDNRGIAAELRIGYTTVRSHSQAVIEKLAARSRLDAVARVYRSGSVDEL